MTRRRPNLPPTESFTPREREVALWLAEDVTLAGIAAKLGISRETVRCHARSIARKVGARARHAIVARLFLRGLLDGQRPR
ncbi:MAG: LuxR C-terminal-related transcriptional regulator [Verrucomicrobiota bacterium]